LSNTNERIWDVELGETAHVAPEAFFAETDSFASFEMTRQDQNASALQLRTLLGPRFERIVLPYYCLRAVPVVLSR